MQTDLTYPAKITKLDRKGVLRNKTPFRYWSHLEDKIANAFRTLSVSLLKRLCSKEYRIKFTYKADKFGLNVRQSCWNTSKKESSEIRIRRMGSLVDRKVKHYSGCPQPVRNSDMQSISSILRPPKPF
jgi:hypothetical protein